MYKTVNGDASRQHDLFQSTPQQGDPANPLNTKSTTRQHHSVSPNHNAFEPTTNRSERDTPVECRSGGGHFGSISQTQPQRLGGQSERDDGVPANYTAARPTQLNQHNAEDDHSLTKRQSQGEEEENSEPYMEMYW